MNPAALIRQEARLIQRSQTGPDDRYGTPTWVLNEVDGRAAVFPMSSEELSQRPGSRARHIGYWLPADTVITENDRIIMATGRGWEVEGAARVWTHPTTAADILIEFDLVDVTHEDGWS